MKLKHINYGMLALFIVLIIANFQIVLSFDMDYQEGSIWVADDQVESFRNWSMVINILTNSTFLWFTGQGVYQIIQLIKRKRNGKRNTTN